jgi:hypothetical protein
VQCFFFAELAILHHFDTIGIVLLIFGGIVVSLLAFGASHGDSDPHVSDLRKMIRPGRLIDLFLRTIQTIVP